MHVGLEATTLRSPQLGGVWRYTDRLIRALGQSGAPHRYSLLFLNAFKPWARVSPPSVSSPSMRLVEVSSASNLLFTFFVPMLARTGRGATVESFLGPVDVFHSVNAAVLPQREGRRVVTVHDLTCLHFPQFHPWTRRTLFRLGIRRAARLADAIIVPSSATKTDLVARFPATEPKIRVIAEAHGQQFLPLSPTAAMRVIGRYGLSYHDYLLFAGNVEPRKNLLAVIEAYNRLRRRIQTAPCLAIAGGEGWRNRPIHRAAAASPFAGDIRFLGHVTDGDLPALMNGALAFVYPSLYARIRPASPGGDGVRDARDHVDLGPRSRREALVLRGCCRARCVDPGDTAELADRDGADRGRGAVARRFSGSGD